MPAASNAVSNFSIHEALWQDCWVAATSSLRSKKRTLQVDFDIRQRVEKLLEEHGPDSGSPLSLRIYGTMLKGFCILNNERARSLHADCERLVVAFVQRPLAESLEQITLPTTKKRKQVDALTLDLDISKVQEAEAFHWLQAAPLAEGSVLRLADAPLLAAPESLPWAGEAPPSSLALPSLLSQHNLLDESFPALAEGPALPPLKLPRLMGGPQEGAQDPAAAATEHQQQQEEPGQKQEPGSEGQGQQQEQQQQQQEGPVPAGAEAQEQQLEHVGQQVRLLQPDIAPNQAGALASASGEGGVRKWRRLSGGPGIVYGFDEDTTLRVAMQLDPDDPRTLDSVMNFRAESSGKLLQLASLLPRQVPEHVGLLDVLISPQLEEQRFGAGGLGSRRAAVQPVLAGGVPRACQDGVGLPPMVAVQEEAAASAPNLDASLSSSLVLAAPLLDPTQMGQSGSDDAAEQVAEALKQHLESACNNDNDSSGTGGGNVSSAGATCSFQNFVPRSVSRGVAALTFHSILTLATNGDILVEQLQSFGSISLALP